MGPSPNNKLIKNPLRAKAHPPRLRRTAPVKPEPSNPAPNTRAAEHDDEGGPKWTDIVVALAAIGSFVFTVALWLSTRGLWVETKRLAGGAEAQSVDMKNSIAEAARAAAAMETFEGRAAQQVAQMTIQAEYMAKTMAAAESSAVAASDLVAITEAGTITINRAYFFFVLESHSCLEFYREEQDYIFFEWHVMNFGKTPGITLSHAAVCGEIDPLMQFPTVQGAPTFEKVVLAEREVCETRRAKFVPIDPIAFRESLRERTAFVFFTGSIAYQDVFGRAHLSSWCVRFEGGERPCINAYGGALLNQRT